MSRDLACSSSSWTCPGGQGMAVDWFLAPFLWVWNVLWGILLRPWAVALLIAVISIVYQAARHQRSRARVSNFLWLRYVVVRYLYAVCPVKLTKDGRWSYMPNHPFIFTGTASKLSSVSSTVKTGWTHKNQSCCYFFTLQAGSLHHATENCLLKTAL